MSETKKFPNQYIDNQFVPYVDEKELKDLIASLAYTISEKYRHQELVLVGVLKGGHFFLCDLVREIKEVKVFIDFVKIAVIKDNHSGIKPLSGTPTFRMEGDITQNITGKHVLIVTEIIASARTLHFLKERLELCKPSSLEFISLFDKPYKRTIPLRANFIGKKIDDQFLVGYGLDLEEYCRNLKNIYYLKYPQ